MFNRITLNHPISRFLCPNLIKKQIVSGWIGQETRNNFTWKLTYKSYKWKLGCKMRKKKHSGIRNLCPDRKIYAEISISFSPITFWSIIIPKLLLSFAVYAFGSRAKAETTLSFVSVTVVCVQGYLELSLTLFNNRCGVKFMQMKISSLKENL